ncbi:DivIVA domain-containing protein [Mycetocola tolaasinivorans]|uniref:Cell wall synthesis protein Wag31 n=1 Tax=Mycetocola tolaasinivorans TaxID=76635 RepID=A0A3L7AF97_9MICO|nr:DivIVA domain-containing protein [Mycetocola tolaasinivorans]RLP78072.1 DivIVA domain-containing protein [Mycetocola tolaasinivorans]
MALTPEDVVNKQFQQTKFREGYDQDEVDDFLDEVVVELRRLVQENQELTERLKAAESGQPAPAAAPVAVAPVAAAPVAAVPAPVSAVPAAAAPAGDDAESSSSLLQLARRLHDEHVKEGTDKRDELIAEGHATAARLIAETEAKQRAQVEILDKQKSVLENKIDELRTFERDYRKQLRGYIEGQLKELDEQSGTGSSK